MSATELKVKHELSKMGFIVNISNHHGKYRCFYVLLKNNVPNISNLITYINSKVNIHNKIHNKNHKKIDLGIDYSLDSGPNKYPNMYSNKPVKCSKCTVKLINTGKRYPILYFRVY